MPKQKKKKEKPNGIYKQTYSDEAMVNALAAVNGGMAIRCACRQFGVPRTTLQDRVHNRVEQGATPGGKTTLKEEDERSLVDYACSRATMGLGFSKSNFFTYAANLSAKRGLTFKSGKPTEKWWRGMKKRHGDIALRKPEGTAAIRHKCMNPIKVSKYFAALNGVLQEKHLLNKPHLIWNMDETGIQLDHVPAKIVARKGSKYVQSRTSGNRELITAVGCGNAVGQAIPAHLVVKGKTRATLHGFDLEKAPTGTTMSVSDSGWTKQGIAENWFSTCFLTNIGNERPQVLIMDGHNSHNFVELIELARKNDIILVELPEHTSHWLQPLDRTVFWPLKKKWNSLCAELMGNNPGLVVSHANFFGIFSDAWKEAFAPHHLISGFRATGIFPYNPLAVPKEAFLASLPTFGATLQEQHIVQGTSTSEATDITNTKPAPSSTIGDVPQEEPFRVASICDPMPGPSTMSTGARYFDPKPGPSTVNDLNQSDNEDVDDELQELLFQVDEQQDEPNDDITDSNPKPCPPILALGAIERALTGEQLAKFQRRLEEGYDVTMQVDPLYHTWQLLKKKMKNYSTDIESFTTKITNKDADIMPYPTAAPKTKASTRPKDPKFFILTSEEAYTSKLEAKKTREKKAAEKEERAKKREQKKSQQSTDKGKKKAKAKNIEEEEDECFICLGTDDDDNPGTKWVQCDLCYKWMHVECIPTTHSRSVEKSRDFLCHLCDEE